MSEVHECKDRSDAIPLYAALGLFLKPIARINITIHYPQLKQTALPAGGKSVSSWELMEKLKALVEPQKFISIKIVKNTLEFIRFEGDLENRDALKTILNRLEGKKLKLTVFKEALKILVAETKVAFPSKYDWDTFFRDTKLMNEMRAGERPDTIHFQNVPSKWFADGKGKLAKNPQPSEKLFSRVWASFGEIRVIDIPVLDPLRSQMSSAFSGIKTFTFNQDPVFEAYVQYKDYMSFVKVMDALRGMFFMCQEGERCWVANVKVNFDKSKHLTEESIRKRRVEREKLLAKEKDVEFRAEKLLKDVEAEEEKDEEKRREMEHKIALEERRYLVARRKLESIRLMDYVLEQVKVEEEAKRGEKEEASSHKKKQKRAKGSPDLEEKKRKRPKSGSLEEKKKQKHAKSASPEDKQQTRAEGSRSASPEEKKQRRAEGSPEVKAVEDKNIETRNNSEEELDRYQRNSAKYYKNQRPSESRESRQYYGPHNPEDSFQYNPNLSRHQPRPYRRPFRAFNPRPRYNNYNNEHRATDQSHHHQRRRDHSGSESRSRTENYEVEAAKLDRAYERYFRSIALKSSSTSTKEEEPATEGGPKVDSAVEK